MEVGGSSFAPGGRNATRRYSHYSPTLQASRLARFQGRKQTYIRYADMSWMVEQGFEFPQQLEVQGANTFSEMNGKIYPSLIWEFYSNFQNEECVYVSLVSGKLITLDEKFFLDVGGLPNSKCPYGDCENELWNSFDSVKYNKSCLCGPQHYVQGELPKSNSFSVENILLYLLIAKIFVQSDNNHEQPMTHDLKLMFRTASSSSRLLGYGIFLSRVFEHMDIDTYGVEVIDIEPKEHLVVGHLIHQLGIFNYGALWEYRENHTSYMDCDESKS
ncbi:hypothetical protein Lal_00036642 [Lupinus albus]|nr:hypothetical protein Lal_00036642 [Lupinus albus]